MRVFFLELPADRERVVAVDFLDAALLRDRGGEDTLVAMFVRLTDCPALPKTTRRAAEDHPNLFGWQSTKSLEMPPSRLFGFIFVAVN